jgi:cardiolipin synthase (CMP-forming)
MNVPNLLTLFRLFLIPVFVLLFFSGMTNSLLYSIYIFLIAGFTDILDGYIARKFNMITKWGTVLDPLADKLMLTSVLTCLVIANLAPLWVLIIITAKEVFMIVAGTILYRDDSVIPANSFGKISTFLFYISIFTLSFDVRFGDYLLYIAVASAIIAFINYFILYHNDKNKIR